jgi:hypothetical protein
MVEENKQTKTQSQSNRDMFLPGKMLIPGWVHELKLISTNSRVIANSYTPLCDVVFFVCA